MKKYSFQLSKSGRTLPMTFDEYAGHPTYTKEEIISIEEFLGRGEYVTVYNKYNTKE